MIREAKRRAENFETWYGFYRDFQLYNDKESCKAITPFIKSSAYDAFGIDQRLREEIPGLNNKLIEMLNEGILELKEKQLSPFEPVTRKAYLDNLFRRFYG